MPAHSHARQPPVLPAPGAAPSSGGALDWFGSAAGQGLLAAEAGAVAGILAGCPALPWVWIGAPAASRPADAGPRGLVLHRGDGFSGAIRCGLPLPLVSDGFGAVLLQHVLDDTRDPDALLGECHRVLAPGGTLWVAALNPWTPYRARWTQAGLFARDPGRWQARLRRAGFSRDAISVQWLGPHWRVAPGAGVEAGVGPTDWLRASLAVTASKRVRALVPLAPLRRLRWQAG